MIVCFICIHSINYQHTTKQIHGLNYINPLYINYVYVYYIHITQYMFLHINYILCFYTYKVSEKFKLMYSLKHLISCNSWEFNSTRKMITLYKNAECVLCVCILIFITMWRLSFSGQSIYFYFVITVYLYERLDKYLNVFLFFIF